MIQAQNTKNTFFLPILLREIGNFQFLPFFKKFGAKKRFNVPYDG